MVYKVDSTRVSLREYWWECRAPWFWPVFVIALFLKLFHIRIRSSTDDLTIDDLRSCRARESDLEPEVLNKFVPRETALGELGFHSPTYYVADDPPQQTAYRMSCLQHDSDQVFAQIRFRLWSRVKPAKESLYNNFVTAFTDGTFLLTTSGKKDLLPPPEVEVINLRGADVEALWTAHQDALEKAKQQKQVRPIDSHSSLLAAVEGLHRLHHEFHVRRGVFVPQSEQEIAKAAEKPKAPLSFTDVDDAAFLKELEAQQAGGRSWLRAAILLVVSLVLFISFGSLAWSKTVALALVPILFFHELGHYVAMRLFGYQNLRMFFIPLFGAAVTGKSYNVAGWKKAVVSLMGPVPGIVVGVILGIVGMVIGQKMLLAAAVMMLVLNGLNLLPLLPLDGGWVAHTLIFSRHSLLDVAFRVATVVLLLGLTFLTQDKIWMYMAIATGVSIPWAYRISVIARKIRAKGIQAVSADGKTIEPQAAVQIFHEIRAASPTGLKPKQGAQLTLQIFEWLNNRPPGILASLALAAVHVGSLITAVVFGAVFVVAMSGGFGEFLRAAVESPKLPLKVAEIKQTTGPDAADDVKVLVGQCNAASEAQAAYSQVITELPPKASATVLGQHVLVAVPQDDDALREQLLTKLEGTCKQAVVASKGNQAWVRLTCIAPNEAAAQKIEEECAMYFDVPKAGYLIPPWSPKASDISPDDLKGRRTFQLLNAPPNFADDPAYENATKQIGRAMRRGDADAMKKAQQELKQLGEKVQTEHRRRVQDEHGDEMRREIVEVFESRPKMAGFDEEAIDEEVSNAVNLEAFKKLEQEQGEWILRVGALMGQLPLQNGKPAEADLQYSVINGHCKRAGLLVMYDFLTFERVDRGAPALAKWLSQRGCNGFQYSIEAGLLDSGEDEGAVAE